MDDLDLETMLEALSPDELEALNFELDPDNVTLPASERCREQTAKTPTGAYDRSKLIGHLEETAKQEEDWQEAVPYVAGVKRGTPWVPKLVKAVDEPEEAAIPLDDESARVGASEPDDLDEVLDGATETDLVDLAGLLGMHNLLSQPQYYNAIVLKPQDENTGTTFKSVVHAALPKPLPDEPPNDTDVDDCIERLKTNDATLEEVNVNNMKRISPERMGQLIAAAKKSEHLKKFSLANTAVSDKEVKGLVDLVKTTKTLKSLNIESNFLTPAFLCKVIKATVKTQSLTEIHAENQRASVLGNRVEMEIMCAVEDNDSLLRVGLPLQSMEARSRIADALERNYERLRLKRVSAD